MILHYDDLSDTLMILFSASALDREHTVSYLPSGLGLLIDDETGGIVGLQIEAFEKQLHRLEE